MISSSMLALDDFEEFICPKGYMAYYWGFGSFFICLLITFFCSILVGTSSDADINVLLLMTGVCIPDLSAKFFTVAYEDW